MSLFKSGKTILLVTHQIAAVERLCNRAVLLDKGLLKLDGTPAEVIKMYMDMSNLVLN